MISAYDTAKVLSQHDLPRAGKYATPSPCAGQPGAGGLRQEAQRQLTSEHKNAVISYQKSSV